MESNACASWFRRNWQWFLPVSTFAAILLLIVFTALVQMAVVGMIRESDLYRDAVTIASTNEGVTRVLGTPIKAGKKVSGKFVSLRDARAAELKFPLAGPQGLATAHVIAFQGDDQWQFDSFRVTIKKTGEVLDLLGDDAR